MRKAEISIAAILIPLMAGMSVAWAKNLPPQTVAQKRLQAECYRRSDSHLNDPFKYPLVVGAYRNPDTLGVLVDPNQWKALPRSERINLLRDVACWYAGGRMLKRYWYDFGAIDPTSERAIEVFTGAELWPKSGQYK